MGLPHAGVEPVCNDFEPSHDTYCLGAFTYIKDK